MKIANLDHLVLTVKDIVKTPSPGSADLCFITNIPINEFIEHCKLNKIKIIQGPAQRTGAIGVIISVYIRDPDENLIEVANYR